MIGPESDKYLKDKIPVSHRVKMIQNLREPRRPMTELGVSCRLGIPSARLTAKRIISPSNHSPRLSLDCRALYSRHIISLSALFALAPIFPSSCAVQAVLYPHLALGFFSAGPQEHFPCEPWPPKDQSLSYELKVNPQIVFFFTVLPNNSLQMQLNNNQSS